jgi:hypothetical protein
MMWLMLLLACGNSDESFADAFRELIFGKPYIGPRECATSICGQNEYCLIRVGGTGGSTTYSCEALPYGCGLSQDCECVGDRASCDRCKDGGEFVECTQLQ